MLVFKGHGERSPHGQSDQLFSVTKKALVKAFEEGEFKHTSKLKQSRIVFMPNYINTEINH